MYIYIYVSLIPYEPLIRPVRRWGEAGRSLRACSFHRTPTPGCKWSQVGLYVEDDDLRVQGLGFGVQVSWRFR